MEQKKKRNLWKILRGEGGNPVKERKISIALISIGVAVVLVASIVMILQQQPTPFVKGISPENAYKLLNTTGKGKPIVVDIRTTEDFEFQGNKSIKDSFQVGLNSTSNSSVDELVNSINNSFYKDQTYIIYEARGNETSMYVAQKMHTLGFRNVYYLIGGFLRWDVEGYSMG